MDQDEFKQTISKLQDQVGEIYCKMREARGTLEVLDERWGYNDPPIDVQYAYLGVKSVLKLGENLADTLERDITALNQSVAPLLPEGQYFDDWDDDDEDDDDDADEQTSEWFDDAQMEPPFQDFEREGISIKVSDPEEIKTKINDAF